MKILRFRLLPILLLAAVFLAACGSTGVLENKDGKLNDLVEIVGARHDRYVKADSKLSEAEKAVLLIETKDFLRPFEKEEIEVTPDLKTFSFTYLDRHDVYVLADSTKDADTIALGLFSSDNIRRTLNEVRIE